MAGGGLGGVNPLIADLKRLDLKGRRIDVRSTAADPLKASWIVWVIARACDRSGFGYLVDLKASRVNPAARWVRGQLEMLSVLIAIQAHL